LFSLSKCLSSIVGRLSFTLLFVVVNIFEATQR
jgi:hypothetical protein